MARKLQLQYAGAIYHVIIRGNYRRDLFEKAGRKAQAFEACLFEACARMRWHLQAYALMRDHFHLTIDTPEPNLARSCVS